jgi:hypothetical protein
MLRGGAVRNEESTREYTPDDIFHPVGCRPSQHVLLQHTVSKCGEWLSRSPGSQQRLSFTQQRAPLADGECVPVIRDRSLDA